MSSSLLRRKRIGCRGAFTLVELLVVIAIIALLVSILLPSLARAREQAKDVKCLANLKDIGSAANAYATSDTNNMLTPMHWRAVSALFGQNGAAPGGNSGVYLLGDIQWGGKGGDPRLFNTQFGSGFGNAWAFTHAWEFGPGDRPLNKIIFKDVGNANWPNYTANFTGGVHSPNENANNEPAAIADNNSEMPVFHCPSDTGWENGRGGNYYNNEGYVRKGRGIDLGVSAYEFFGNSYKNSMNWVSSGGQFYSTTIWGTPQDRVHTPSRLVMFTEGNAEDTCYFNRPELEGTTGNVDEWWVSGWHQPSSEIQEFNTNFADGHAGKMNQAVPSGYTNYVDNGNGTEFTAGDLAIRGSRPESIRPPYGWGEPQERFLGWWGDKLFRGDGWTIDNLPAPPQLVMPLSG
jgi:prepilin-type N-terminal cleavage/methylation domain-containing protein